MIKWKKDPIIKAIAESTIYSYEEIRVLYDKTKSYDALISVCIAASLVKWSCDKAMDFISQYSRPAMIRPIPLKDVFAYQGVK